MIEKCKANAIVKEALEDLRQEREDIDSQIELIESMDWTKPVDEDTWHKICETPIRGTKLLAILVKNVFPKAQSIEVGCNYVYFKLDGVKIQIPIYAGRGINIATDWYNDISYQKEHRGPAHAANMVSLKKYFEAKDNNLGWKEKAKARAWDASKYNDFQLFWLWFTNWRWKKIDRKWFEEAWNEEEWRYNNETLRLEQIDVENKRHLEFVLKFVMPELDKFSTTHYSYCDQHGHHDSITEIMKKEGVE